MHTITGTSKLTGERVVLQIDKAIPRWEEVVGTEKAMAEERFGGVDWNRGRE